MGRPAGAVGATAGLDGAAARRAGARFRQVAAFVAGATSIGGHAAPEPSTAGVQAAEKNRSLPQPAPAPSSAAPAAQRAEPEPDLDALAKQVYDVLKRRLAAERRRLGS